MVVGGSSVIQIPPGVAVTGVTVDVTLVTFHDYFVFIPTPLSFVARTKVLP